MASASSPAARNQGCRRSSRAVGRRRGSAHKQNKNKLEVVSSRRAFNSPGIAQPAARLLERPGQCEGLAWPAVAVMRSLRQGTNPHPAMLPGCVPVTVPGAAPAVSMLASMSWHSSEIPVGIFMSTAWIRCTQHSRAMSRSLASLLCCSSVSCVCGCVCVGGVGVGYQWGYLCRCNLQAAKLC